MANIENEWLWGWDTTPGIVSVWAALNGTAQVFRRVEGALVHETAQFRPWLVVDSLDYVRHLGTQLLPEGAATDAAARAALPVVSYEELAGPGQLRFVLRAADGTFLQRALAQGASRVLGRSIHQVRDLGTDRVLVLAPEDQYLVQSGRSYFRELGFDALQRLSFDLETTGLDPEHNRIFMVAVRDPAGAAITLEAEGPADVHEAQLITRLCAHICACDPDIIENHNLHGFDLPFLARRAEKLGVSLMLGRDGKAGLTRRAAARGARLAGVDSEARERARRARFSVMGRECIDTMDAVRRHDFSARDLPGHGLKVLARHFGFARADRELIPGAEVFATYARDPERVRRYALEDVHEASALARLLGGAAFALAQMVPRRYERLADAGAATGVIDPLLVRAYLRSGAALPAHASSDGTPHSGAALHLFASGVAQRVVKADVASLYPSLMRQYRIGPARDRLSVLLTVVDNLVELRLAAKSRAKREPAGSAARFRDEALSAAMKLVVNSAYGYLGASGLTRFSDVHAANEVTRRGRELLGLLCRALAERGVTLLEADTDGVYFSVPDTLGEADERRIVAEVGALLPEKVKLEFEGRYAAMLSHEPKNYALLGYAGELTLRGVAFRSRRAEPYGEAFLRESIAELLRGNVAGVHACFMRTCAAIQRRSMATREFASQVRLTKTPAAYASARSARRELPYEALLAAGQSAWNVGDRVFVYRASGKRAALLPSEAYDEESEGSASALDPRDYDSQYYVRLLRDTFASRLASALTPDAYAAVFADPAQLSLFAPDLAEVRPILTVLSDNRLGH